MGLLISGSSFTLPAHGWCGARARINNSALKKSARPSEDGSAGGVQGGNAEPSERKNRGQPPACSFRAEPSKILFSLIEKMFRGRAQIRKSKEYFARRRVSASGGGAERQFRSKKIRAKFRISHQSQLSPFWERIASRLRRSAFGLCARRKAIKSHGGQKEKEMDLSFSYLK
jgi:hypothetical protein